MGLEKQRAIMLGEGWVMHARPGKNYFNYPIYNLLIRVEDDAFAKLGERRFLRVLSKDYLDGTEGSMKEKITQFLATELNYSCDQIWLQTMPRVFGYGFNPVNFWYCYKQGELDAVLCEVNNTFGDRHYYFVNNTQDGGTKLAKEFHVSPFFPIHGHYNFKFNKKSDETDVSIKLFHDQDLKIETGLSLKFRELDQVSSFYLLKKYGWITAMVIFRIHYQALKLWLKGIEFFRRPLPPKEKVTYVK